LIFLYSSHLSSSPHYSFSVRPPTFITIISIWLPLFVVFALTIIFSLIIISIFFYIILSNSVITFSTPLSLLSLIFITFSFS
jgi:hypothetical protein